MKFERISKKIVAAALAVSMIFGSAVTGAGSYMGLSTAVNAAEITTSGFGYETNSDGTITITGYNGSNTKIVIPSVIDGKTVTKIGDDAFKDCSELKSVTIPDSVKEIGSYSFAKCTGLTDITIPESVEEIDAYTFWNCTALTEITIPDSVTLMGVGIFYGCTGLKSIKIPGSVTAIHYGTFYKCTGLINAQIGSGIKSISEEVFDGCINLKNVTIPDSVTSIGDSAFDNCNKLTIYGTKGSYAETYANNKGIAFAVGLANNSTISNTTINYGDSVTLTGKASDGTSPYQYSFLYKHSTETLWTTLTSYGTTSTKVWQPAKSGTYIVRTKVRDSYGTEIIKDFTLTVKAALENISTISKTTINYGDTVTLTGKASGGTSPYQYSFLYKHSTETSWTTLSSYHTSTTLGWKPAKTGRYSKKYY